MKITYRIVTGLFSACMLLAGITEVIQPESGRQIMQHLGYPTHVLIVLGIGKILAVGALLPHKFNVVKEWAYAARAYSHDSLGLILSPLIFLAIMFVTYFLWKKTEQPPTPTLRLVPNPEPYSQVA